jgi:sugar O-acyltransferase (sialic acid O-acetyltransferase NeuD family)
MRRLVVLGSTGPEIVKLLAALKSRELADFEVMGFLDDNPDRHGAHFMGYPVLGGSDLLKSEFTEALVINNVAKTTALRHKVWKRLEGMGARFYTAIHPGVDVSYTTIGPGAIVQEGVVMGPEVVVGQQCIVCFGSIIAHESSVGDCCFLAPGTVINGRVNVREGAFVGAGAIVLPNITIGEWSLVGAGSVVTEDVPPHCTVFGSPARVIADRRPRTGA